MPNTKPVVDSAQTVDYIINKSKNSGVSVYPVGCITAGLKGEELCDYKMLKAAGAVAVSDDGRPVESQNNASKRHDSRRRRRIAYNIPL